MYTYGIYMKWKDGDYTAEDEEIRTRQRRLIVPGKGYVDVTFVLQAQEYKV